MQKEGLHLSLKVFAECKKKTSFKLKVIDPIQKKTASFKLKVIDWLQKRASFKINRIDWIQKKCIPLSLKALTEYKNGLLLR